MHPRDRRRGFSLIELLVVIAILAAIATVTVISADLAGETRRMQREIDRLFATIALGCDRAQISGQAVGMHLSQNAYAFSQYDGQWRFIEDPAFKPHELPAGATLAFEAEDQRLEMPERLGAEPLVTCVASGELNAFRLTIRFPGDEGFSLGTDDEGILRHFPRS